MQYKLTYSRIANKYFFISNLSQWHWSSRKDYNDVWLKKTGALSIKEKRALEEFSKIAKKYGFNKNNKLTWLGAPFFKAKTSKTAWKKVQNWTKETEYETLKKIFDCFEDRFNEIWNKNEKKLKIARKKIQNGLQSSVFEKSIRNLEIFYGQNLPQDKSLFIYLLICPKDSPKVGGGAIMGKSGITLEIRNTDEREIKGYLLTILHEIGHVFLEKNKLPLIKEEPIENNIPEDDLPGQPTENIVSELILRSITPNILGRKYFDVSPKRADKKEEENLFNNLKPKVEPDISKYLEQGKEIDKNLIIKTISLVKSYYKKKRE